MKKPDSIIICSRKYAILYTESGWQKPSQFGMTDYLMGIIHIREAGRPEAEILRTIIHEVLHAIGHEYRLLELKMIGYEEKVDKLAAALAMVCMDNFMEGKNVR
jgi:hypothetical protein